MSKAASRSLLLYLVPALICGNALLQRYLAEKHHLNPWKGGGFGMFAAVPPPRGFYVHPQGTKMIFQTPTPSGYEMEAKRLLFMPTESGLQELADELAGKKWFLIGLDRPEAQRYPVLEQDAVGRNEPITITKVTVGVCEYQFDPETSEMKYTQLVEVVGTPEG